LANLGVYLEVTDDHQSNWPHHQRLSSVLVNGDDMLYAAPVSLWDRHIETAGKAGLEMSVGKSYHHPVYANVNSISFHYSLRKECTPWQINYLNCGLFYGQHKVQGSDKVSDDELKSSRRVSDEKLANMYAKAHIGQDPTQGLLTNVNTLLNGTLPGKQIDILKQFLSHHVDEIKKETVGYLLGDNRLFTRNIFTSQSTGGMGVIHPTARSGPGPKLGVSYYVTLDQRRLARHIAMSTPMSIDRQLPAQGPVIQALDDNPRFSYMKKFGVTGELITHEYPRDASLDNLSKRNCFLPLIYYASPLEKRPRPYIPRKLKSFQLKPASRALYCDPESDLDELIRLSDELLLS